MILNYRLFEIYSKEKKSPEYAIEFVVCTEFLYFQSNLLISERIYLYVYIFFDKPTSDVIHHFSDRIINHNSAPQHIRRILRVRETIVVRPQKPFSLGSQQYK